MFKSIEIAIVILLCMIPMQFARAQAPNAQSQFQVFLPKDGLTNGAILAVYQDHLGYMWFGGSDGLIRFDGYDFEKYEHKIGRDFTLQHNTVRALVEDRAHQLWIATDAGLHRYVRDRNQFEVFTLNNPKRNIIHALVMDHQGFLWLGTDGGLVRFDPLSHKFHYFEAAADTFSLTDTVIYSLLVDKNNTLWVGTVLQGLVHYNPSTRQTQHYLHNEADSQSLPHNVIKALYEARDGTLWVGSYAGLGQFDPLTRRFRNYQHSVGNSSGLSGPAVYGMVEDARDNLWVATNNGLSILNRKAEKIVQIFHAKNDPTTLASDKIRSLFKDKNGDIWLGNFPQGVSYFNQEHIVFETVRSLSADSTVSSILSFMQDKDGQIWLGTDGGGVYVLDQYGSASVSYTANSIPVNSEAHLSSNFVLDVVQDGDGRMWMGTWGGGLNHFDPTTERFSYYSSRYDEKNVFVSRDIWALLVDSKNRLWVGTIGGSLSQYQREQDSFKTWFHDPANSRSLSSTVVWTIHEDRNGSIWIGTDNGLNRYDEESDSFTHYRHEPERSSGQALSHDVVLSMLDDAEGYLWLGTRGGGLNRLHIASGKVTHYGAEQGLKNLVVASIEEDDFGNLWLGTHGGLIRFNKASEVFRHFDRDDGLQGNHFNINASLKLKDGRLIFGGTDGFTRFHPRDIPRELPAPPTVVLRDFKIKHRSVYAGEDDALSAAIGHGRELKLTQEHSVITLDFSALNYRHPNKIAYAYTLKGFDDQWYEVGQSRSATYTNLGVGNYEFLVKASIDGGVWSGSPARLAINMQPPLWWYWLGYGIVVMVIVGGFMFMRKFAFDFAYAKRSRAFEYPKFLQYARNQKYRSKNIGERYLPFATIRNTDSACRLRK